MINFGLAREVYGNTPWMVDHSTLGVLLNMLQDFRNGVAVDSQKEKYNNSFLCKIENKSVVISEPYQLKNLSAEDQAVSIIHLNGPITKNGGSSSYGTKHLAAKLLSFDKDVRVKGHVIITDSGGGAASGVPHLADAIKASTKPVYGFVEKGGVAASAALYILSYTKKIISESPKNKIGSIGTMIEIHGYPKQHEMPDGEKRLRMYATGSINKNEEFE